LFQKQTFVSKTDLNTLFFTLEKKIESVEMTKILRLIYFIAVFTCLNVCILYPLKAQNSVTDTAVELLMKQNNYAETATLISAKLKSTSNLTTDHLLYYNSKLSIAQLRLRNIDSALVCARVAIVLSKKSKDSTLIVDAWKAVAYSFNNAGKLDSALFYTQKMMLYGERNGDEKLSRNAIVSMATILTQNKRYDEALNYYRKAAVLTTKLKDTANFSSSLYNLGLTFLNLKQTDSCLIYLQQAAVEATKRQWNDLLVYIYGTTADCYLLLKNNTEQKKYLLLANGIAEKIGAKQFLAMGYSNLTTGALEEGNYSETLVYGRKALELLEEQPYPVLKIKLDSMMCMAHQGMGDYKEAFLYLNSFIREKEKVVNERQQEQLNKLVVDLQVKEKDLKIADQQLEIAHKQRNIQLTILIAIIILLITFGQFFYILKTRKFRKKLFRKEKELEQETKEIKEWMEWKYNKDLLKTEENKGIQHPEKLENENIALNAQTLLFAELREVFENQKLYLDPELNIKTLIKILGTNQKYLYHAINDNSDSNFRSFLNRYRVDEAKRIIEQKIKKDEYLNLSEIYAMAGFNSSVSFYRAFKHITGLKPKEYASELRNTLPKNAKG